MYKPVYSDGPNNIIIVFKTAHKTCIDKVGARNKPGNELVLGLKVVFIFAVKYNNMEKNCYFFIFSVSVECIVLIGKKWLEIQTLSVWYRLWIGSRLKKGRGKKWDIAIRFVY